MGDRRYIVARRRFRGEIVRFCPDPSSTQHHPSQAMRPITKLLVANRSEIAIRVFRSAHELGIRTVAIYAHEDRFALHRFKADEAYLVGKPGEPIRSYLDIDSIVALAKAHGVDGIHPRLRLPLGESRVCGGLHHGRHHVRRPAGRVAADARRQDRRPRPRP